MNLLMSPLGIATFAYIAFALGLALAAFPSRIRMTQLAEAMLAETHWTERERWEINNLLDTCLSFRIGFAVPFAITTSIFSIVSGSRRNPKEKLLRLFGDRRFDRIVIFYFISILAANPFAMILSIPLAFVSVFISLLLNWRATKKRKARSKLGSIWSVVVDAVDIPVVDAAHTRPEFPIAA